MHKSFKGTKKVKKKKTKDCLFSASNPYPSLFLSPQLTQQIRVRRILQMLSNNLLQALALAVELLHVTTRGEPTINEPDPSRDSIIRPSSRK